MSDSPRLILTFLSLATLTVQASAAATLVSVNFNGTAHTEPTYAKFATYAGDSLASSETAGIIPAKNWNSVKSGYTFEYGTSSSLNDSTGATTVTTLSWESNDSWHNGNQLPVPAWTNGDQHMSYGNIKANYNASSPFVPSLFKLTFKNLPVGGYNFTLLAYTSLDDSAAKLNISLNDDAAQTRAFTEASGFKTTWTDEGTNTTLGVYTDTGDHAKFTGTKTAGGDLVITYYSGNGGGAGFNGLQLSYEAIPEPTALSILALGALGLLARRRRI